MERNQSLYSLYPINIIEYHCFTYDENKFLVTVKWLLFGAYIYILLIIIYVEKRSYISTEGSILSYDGIALNDPWLVCIKSAVQWSFQILHHQCSCLNKNN